MSMEELQKIEIIPMSLPQAQVGRQLARVLRDRDFVVRALVTVVVVSLLMNLVTGLLLLAWIHQGTIVVELAGRGPRNSFADHQRPNRVGGGKDPRLERRRGSHSFVAVGRRLSSRAG